ncbi:MAG: DUF7553 family protein [Halobacteriota archaeon]
MTREQLQSASDEARQAAELADGDVQQRLYDQSDQLATLASADRDPDHGRLDRHMNILAEIAGHVDDEVAERVTAARDSVSAFRETVEGV